MRSGPFGPGDGDGQPEHGRRTGNLAAGDRARRPVAHRRHPLGEAAVQRHRGHGRGKVERAEAGTAPSVLISARTGDDREVRFHHGNPRLVRQYPSRSWLCDDHHLGPGVDRGPDIPAGRREARARDDLSRRDTPSRKTRHLRQPPLALDIADRRADNDQELAVTDVRSGLPGRTLVALATEGSGARLHGRGRMGGPPGECLGRQKPILGGNTGRDGRGPGRGKRQHAGPHRAGCPAHCLRLASRPDGEHFRRWPKRGSRGI